MLVVWLDVNFDKLKFQTPQDLRENDSKLMSWQMNFPLRLDANEHTVGLLQNLFLILCSTPKVFGHYIREHEHLSIWQAEL